MSEDAFVDHPSFREKNAEAKLFSVKVREHDASWFTKFVMEDRKGMAQDMNVTGYQEPWTKEEEQRIFLQFNYARYRVHLGDSTFAPTVARLQDQIANANLGLICLTVTKYRPPCDDDRDDYISEAQAALCRAILRFDVLKDHKFSTYACSAMFRAVARQFRRYSRDIERMMTTSSPDLLDTPTVDDRLDEQTAHIQHALKSAKLDRRERQIIHYRYFADPTWTLERIGKKLGCTKEWVRQIEARVLARIKDSYQNG